MIDNFNREGLTIDIGLSLPAERVVRALARVIEWRGIQLDFIQPGNPQQNAYIERYNRTVRYDWLNQHLFETIAQVQDYATRWLWTYNNERPNHGDRRHHPKTQAGHVGLTSTNGGSYK